MDETQLKIRVKKAVKKELPEPCGIDCPYVCCEPIITGSFMSRELFQQEDDYTAAIAYIQTQINETLDMKTTEGKDCFVFKGLILTEIDTNNGFISDHIIEDIILKKVQGKVPPAKLQEYVNKVKARFRETNAGIIILFNCPFFDGVKKGCTIYEQRPQLCRTFMCEQVSPELVNFSKKEMLRRITLKKEQRDFILDNYQTDIYSAITAFWDQRHD